MNQVVKYILVGSLVILLLTLLVGFVAKDYGLLPVVVFPLALFLVPFFAVKGVFAVLMRLAGPSGEGPVSSGPTLRQVLVFLGSGVVLGGSTCFGAASMMPQLFHGDPWWALPILFLCALGFFIAVAITLVGLVKLIHRAIISIRGRS
jgi:hypothetical protein